MLNIFRSLRILVPAFLCLVGASLVSAQTPNAETLNAETPSAQTPRELRTVERQEQQTVTVVTDSDVKVNVVHEALTDVPETIIAPLPPPVPRAEPAATAPATTDAVWVPGYWSWNATSANYEWISGVWRRAIPNLVWHPGEWIAVENGYLWRNGYWGAATAAEIVVAKQAPPEIRVETQTASPTTGYVWVPGYWEFVNGNYLWRPGSWQLPAAPGLVWVAPQWVETTAGYQYFPGHWDYPSEARTIVVSERADAGAAGKLFAESDLNKDGELTLLELQSARPNLTTQEFSDLDTDRDGLLNPQEMVESGSRLP